MKNPNWQIWTSAEFTFDVTDALFVNIYAEAKGPKYDYNPWVRYILPDGTRTDYFVGGINSYSGGSISVDVKNYSGTITITPEAQRGDGGSGFTGNDGRYRNLEITRQLNISDL